MTVANSSATEPLMPPPPQSMHRVRGPELDMIQTYPQVTVATLQPATRCPLTATPPPLRWPSLRRCWAGPRSVAAALTLAPSLLRWPSSSCATRVLVPLRDSAVPSWSIGPLRHPLRRRTPPPHPAAAPPTPRPGASATNYTLVAQKTPKSPQIPATSVQLAEMPAAPAHSPLVPPCSRSPAGRKSDSDCNQMRPPRDRGA